MIYKFNCSEHKVRTDSEMEFPQKLRYRGWSLDHIIHLFSFHEFDRYTTVATVIATGLITSTADIR